MQHLKIFEKIDISKKTIKSQKCCMSNYTHLNEENRFEIYEHRQEGLSIREIAEKISKNASSL